MSKRKAPKRPEEKQALKAFLFAHSDSSRPLRTLLPHDSCLASFPLLNIPIIAYQLDALVRGGVEDVTILTSRNASMLRDVLEPTIVGDGTCGSEYDVGGMSVRILCDEGWHSDGDALREIESTTDLRPQSDFLLISAGAIINIDIQSLVEKHKRRRKEDRSWVMTSVFRRGGQYLTRSTLTIVLDGHSNALLKYKEAYTSEGLAVDTTSSVSSFRTGGEVDIFTDIVNCGVDICGPELLLEFRENPDYDRLRDYVRTKLEGGEAEVLGNRICAHLINSSMGEYAAMIESAAAYDSLVGDVLAGWLTPLTPDRVACGLNLNIPTVKCLSKRNHVYVSFSPGTAEHSLDTECLEKLRDCVVSSTAEIGLGAEIWNSVIGPDVSVGPGAQVHFSHLMKNVELRHGAIVHSAILGQDVTVGRQCVVPEGCVLGPGSKIGSHFHLKPGTWTAVRVYTQDHRASEDEWESESTDSAHEWDDEEVGGGGIGALVPKGGKGDPFSDVGSASWGLKYGSGDDDSDDESGYQLEVVDRSREVVEHSHRDRFVAEIRDNLQRGLNEDIEVDNLAMEINSLKLVYDRSVPETCSALVRAIIGIERGGRVDPSRAAIHAKLKELISKWRPLLDKYHLQYTEKDEAALLEDVRTCLHAASAQITAFMDVVRILYENEVVSEDGIFRWRHDEKARIDRRQSGGQELEAARELFRWLEEAEEESDDEE